MKQRRLRHLDAADERLFDVLQIVEPACADEIDDQMRTGEAFTVAFDKEILALLLVVVTRSFGQRLHLGEGGHGVRELENFRLGLP